MGVIIKSIAVSKNEVATKENFKISVEIRETPKEPKKYRLPMQLGQAKGVLK